MEEAEFRPLHHAYGHISAQGPPATTAGPISGHLRLLYASIGTDQPGRPGSPNYGAAWEAPDDSKKQAKPHAYQTSLPSHDAGHPDWWSGTKRPAIDCTGCPAGAGHVPTSYAS